MTDCAEIFGRIYRTKLWGDGSGGGASPEAARPFGEIASAVIRKLRPRMVLDIGCGDGHAAQYIDLGDALYIGIDAVPEMIDYATRCYRASGRVFLVRDALAERLPFADLAIVKEVTQHLDNRSIRALVEKLSIYPAVLHVSALGPQTGDIETGGFRPVRLRDFGIVTEYLGEWASGETNYMAELWRP